MKSLRPSLKALRKVARPFWGRVLVSILIGLLRIAASMTFVWISKALVDVATGTSEGSLWLYVGIMVGTMLVQLACGVAAPYWERLTLVYCQNSLRYKYFGHVLRSTWNGRESFHSGDSLNRIFEDVRVVTDLVCVRIPNIILTLCQFLAAGIFLSTLSPGLLWIILLVTVVTVFASKIYYRRMRELTERIRKTDSRIQQHMQENIQNRVLALTLFGTDRILSRMDDLQDDLKDDTVKRLNVNAYSRTLMSAGFMLGYFSAFLWSILGIRSGAVTYGMMTAFLQLVGQVQRPVSSLTSQIPALIEAATSLDRLTELSSLPGETQGEPVHMEGAPGIRFEGVSFNYPDSGNRVFERFNYDFAPGSFTAVTGPTGIGKSTLIRLALALLRPSEGSVTLYDSTNSVAASPLTRCNFTYVPQGNTLVSGTIRENLLLAAPEASEEEMKEALKDAAADFVFDLKDGLDERCGESGSGLSEGQSQRIAIARALLHPSGIMVLDEATSSLDPETEQTVLENLISRCHSRKTVIFISHREAVSVRSDSVLALDGMDKKS